MNMYILLLAMLMLISNRRCISFCTLPDIKRNCVIRMIRLARTNESAISTNPEKTPPILPHGMIICYKNAQFWSFYKTLFVVFTISGLLISCSCVESSLRCRMAKSNDNWLVLCCYLTYGAPIGHRACWNK